MNYQNAHFCSHRPASRVLRSMVATAALGSGILALSLSAAPAQQSSSYSRCAGVNAALEETIAACTAIIQSSRESVHNHAVGYANRGIAWAMKGDLDGAIADFGQAIRLNPNLSRAFFNRGNAYRRKRLFDQALSDFNRAIEIDPGFAPAHERRAMTLLHKAEYDRAIASAARAIQLAPTQAPAYVTRASAYMRKGDLNRAAADINEALRLDPGFVPAHVARGALRSKQGNDRGALADFENALRLHPQNAAALAHRGLAYEKQGQQERALADFRAALAIDPERQDALAGVARLRPAAPVAAVPLPRARPATIATAPAPAANEPATTGSARAVQPPTALSPPDSDKLTRNRSLGEALAACAKLSDEHPNIALGATVGKSKLEVPTCYRGRRHLDCAINAMLEEASAIDRDYADIVRANYPNLKDAQALCRIEPARLREHLVRSKSFDARAAAVQKALAASSSCVGEMQDTISKLSLGAMRNSGELMQSLRDSIRAPLDQAAGRQREVLRLAQGIEESREAINTVIVARSLLCP